VGRANHGAVLRRSNVMNKTSREDSQHSRGMRRPVCLEETDDGEEEDLGDWEIGGDGASGTPVKKTETFESLG